MSHNDMFFFSPIKFADLFLPRENPILFFLSFSFLFFFFYRHREAFGEHIQARIIQCYKSCQSLSLVLSPFQITSINIVYGATVVLLNIVASIFSS